jgi:hypothetical protein
MLHDRPFHRPDDEGRWHRDELQRSSLPDPMERVRRLGVDEATAEQAAQQALPA